MSKHGSNCKAHLSAMHVLEACQYSVPSASAHAERYSCLGPRGSRDGHNAAIASSRRTLMPKTKVFRIWSTLVRAILFSRLFNPTEIS